MMEEQPGLILAMDGVSVPLGWKRGNEVLRKSLKILCIKKNKLFLYRAPKGPALKC